MVSPASSAPSEGKGSWPRIIEAVRSPLGISALLLLILSAVLLVLAQRVQAADLRILLIGVLVLLFAALVLAFAAGSRAAPQSPEFLLRTENAFSHPEPKYDAFLSAPMAALGDKEYEDVRSFALEIKKSLQTDRHMRDVFYAADDIKTKDGFDPHDSAVLQDFKAISESRYFVLLLPKRIASSVLFEAGVALGIGKHCVYFVKDRKHLPFLMQQAELAFRNVKVYEYKGLTDLRKLLQADSTFDFGQRK